MAARKGSRDKRKRDVSLGCRPLELTIAHFMEMSREKNMTEEGKASRAALTVLVKAKRSRMGRAARARRKKPARWLYPWAVENRYAAAYRAWFRPVRDFVHEYVQKHREAVLMGDSADAVVRQDEAAGESFNTMVRSLNGWAGAYISDDEEKKLRSPVYIGLGNIADSAFDFNGIQYDKSVKSALGIQFPSDEGWWPSARELWQDMNYDIIRSDIKKYIADINAATEQAVTNGWSAGKLSAKIQELDDKISRSRARFIARDQMGKLNGQVSQHRMQDIGLSMYEWSTSGDERVRESHEVMEGLLCRWDDAEVCSHDNGKTWVPRPAGAVLMHPGMDYQCRCCALPWFDEILNELDAADGIVPDYGPEETAEFMETTETPEMPMLEEDFIPATNISGSNAYAKNILGIPHADYKGVSLEAANEWNRGVTDNFRKFPELKDQFGFVGESHARNAAMKEKYKELYFQEKRADFERQIRAKLPNASPEEIREITENTLEEYSNRYWQKNYGKHLKVPKLAVAQSYTPIEEWCQEFAGITVNKDHVKDYSDFLKRSERAVAAKYHPVGTETLKATLDHEIGHQLDSMLDLRTDSVILDLWGKLSHEQITEGLSVYAWNNTNPQPIREFIAEAWSEYCNNPAPRPIAKKVGERIEEVYKEWKRK